MDGGVQLVILWHLLIKLLYSDFCVISELRSSRYNLPALATPYFFCLLKVLNMACGGLQKRR